jgi:peptide/nickel transport system permease protein
MPLRLLKYLSIRTVVVFLTVVASVYVAIIGVNLGGAVDDIRRSLIMQTIILPASSPEMQALTPEQRTARWMEMVESAYEAAGLNRPFLVRSFEYLVPALTLDLGSQFAPLGGSLTMRGTARYPIHQIILDRLPATLLLLGISNSLIFISSVGVGLFASRRRGGVIDRLLVALSPISAVPAWFYGIFLIVLFAGVLPTSGMYPTIPPDSRLLYALEMGKHLILPFLALFLSTFFHTVYLWRTFFLIHADEDYVDLAKAKGLKQSLVSRRYILRPTLPAIFTSFSLTMIGIWSGSVILETLFNWPGLGRLFVSAIVSFNTAMLVGLTVIYAYLLGITLLILDFAYAIVDPRIRIGNQQNDQQPGRVAGQPLRVRWQQWVSSLPQRFLAGLQTSLKCIASWNLRVVVRTLSDLLAGIPRSLKQAGRMMRELMHIPSAVVGMLIIAVLAASILYTVREVPYDEAVAHWRSSVELIDNPQNGRPAWFNLFYRTKQPPTMSLDSRLGEADRQVVDRGFGEELLLTFAFDYDYDGFPQDIIVYFDVEYDEKAPHVEITWFTPDGRELRVTEMAPTRSQIYRVAHDTRLARRLHGQPPEEGLFVNPAGDGAVSVKGTYQLQISNLFFEEEGDLEARLVLRGQVYGIAGTDHRRRDLMVGLLWGTPTVLAFGLLGALFTGVGAMLIAAISVWYGGMVDSLLQRLTEINLALPTFPILVLLASYYTLSIWYVLALAIVLSIFGHTIKTYRAIFLQAKTAPYIEAARAYGTGDARMIRKYLLPRIAPVLIPQMVTLVPSFVFLEAALAFLGQSDPILPTWGKIIHEAHIGGALLTGNYYWIMQPTILLLLVGLAFALLGYGLDRVLNPRLRDI